MITKQRPTSVIDGFVNLINTTLPDGITCSLANPSGIECASAEEILALSTSPACNSSLLALSVAIMDANATSMLVNQTLYSSPQLQQIEYTVLGNRRRELNISLQVVSSSGNYYYILFLNHSSIGLELPPTAIPANFPQSCAPQSTKYNFWWLCVIYFVCYSNIRTATNKCDRWLYQPHQYHITRWHHLQSGPSCWHRMCQC